MNPVHHHSFLKYWLVIQNIISTSNYIYRRITSYFDESSYALIEVKYYLSCQLIHGSNSNKYSLSKLDVDKNDFGVTMCYLDGFKQLVTNYKTKNHHTHLLNVSYFSVDI